MPHNCPPEWVHVIGLGCFQSWGQFYGFLGVASLIAIVIGASLFFRARRGNVHNERK